MNVFNQLEIEGEPLLESCDECNALIVNWETLTNSFLTFDNRVVCKKCLKESVDFPEEILQSIYTMNEELVTYEVELDSPDFFVSFQAEKGLSLEQIEFLAIQEMTRNTRVWNVKIVE